MRGVLATAGGVTVLLVTRVNDAALLLNNKCLVSHGHVLLVESAANYAEMIILLDERVEGL